MLGRHQGARTHCEGHLADSASKAPKRTITSAALGSFHVSDPDDAVLPPDRPARHRVTARTFLRRLQQGRSRN
ncbi:hypothetical protein CHELA40_40124 [Chelatococcus asaccharovorans]|nr:hypothetical protein CHELA17_50070 [Chelatococcus asaccharovorans]CAH1689896.1 hypothetical protein CHELA40_40124 [Chelatococcus asaccharovorans]